jgi:hypothetical protein
VLRETLIAGLIGAGVVALWFLVVDVVRGQVWFTPAALGSALFFGARQLAEVQVTPAVIIGYTLVHIAAFLAIAFFAVQVMRAAEFEPRAWLGVVLLFVVMEVFALGMLAILASWLLEAMPLWMVAIANVLAALAMGTFLWKAHPMMREDLRFNVEDAQ